MPTVPGNISSLAREYTPQAITKLAKLMRFADSEAVQLGACIALLDRGWGRAPQAHTGENGEGAINVTIRHIVQELRDRPMKVVSSPDTRVIPGDT